MNIIKSPTSVSGTITGVYMENLNKLLRENSEDQTFTLAIKYGRSWKERLFSWPWRPWIKYVKTEEYKGCYIADIDFGEWNEGDTTLEFKQNLGRDEDGYFKSIFYHV